VLASATCAAEWREDTPAVAVTHSVELPVVGHAHVQLTSKHDNHSTEIMAAILYLLHFYPQIKYTYTHTNTYTEHTIHANTHMHTHTRIIYIYMYIYIS